MLDLHRMRLVREVARRGSFAAAAEALAYTRPAVSQQITALERELGVQLFVRGARGTVLTPVGEVLLGRAERLLEEVASIEAELAQMAVRDGGRLRLGSFPTATSIFAAAAAQAFRVMHPDAQLRLIDGEPFESLRRLRDGELDMAIVFAFGSWPAGLDYDGRLVARDDEVMLEPLLEDPFALVLRADHALAAQRVVPLAALAGEHLIGGPPWSGQLLALARATGVELRVDDAFRTTDFAAQQALAVAGMGLTFVPRLAASLVRAELVLRPTMPEFRRTVSLAFPQGRERPVLAQAMAADLRHAVAGLEERADGGETPPGKRHGLAGLARRHRRS